MRLSAAVLPAHVSAPTCYGPGLAALGAYLLGRQHLPIERAAACLAEAFDAPVSTGWLASLSPAVQAGLDGFEAIAREQLAGAPVAHFDETGARHGLCNAHHLRDRVVVTHLEDHAQAFLSR